MSPAKRGRKDSWLSNLGVLVVAVGLPVLIYLWGTQGLAQPKMVVVVEGDTVRSLAKTYGVTEEELVIWNRLEGPVEPGEVLYVYASGQSGWKNELSGASTQEVREALEKVMSAESAGSAGSAASESKARVTATSARPRALRLDPIQFSRKGKAPEGPQPLPAPQPCAKAQGKSDPGLEADGLNAAIAESLPYFHACKGAPTAPRTRLVFTLKVGCDGVVDKVLITERGNAELAYLTCLADVLSHVDFPAHAQPNGQRIAVPITLLGQSP